MSAALTPAQRDRLNSREVRILRSLIFDMLFTAEDAAIEYATSDTETYDGGAKWVDAQDAITHGHAALSCYVGGAGSLLEAWDGAASGTAERATLAPWRARLAAALAIPEPAGAS